MAEVKYGPVACPGKGAIFPGGEMLVIFVDFRPAMGDLGDAFWATTADDSSGFSEQHISQISRAMKAVCITYPTSQPSRYFNCMAHTYDGRTWNSRGAAKGENFKQASFSWETSLWRWTVVEEKEGISLHYLFSPDSGSSWRDHWVELDSKGLPTGFGCESRQNSRLLLSCRSRDGQQWLSPEGEQVAATPPVGIEFHWWRAGFRGPGFANPQEVVAYRADISSRNFASGKHAGFIFQLLGGERNGVWDAWYDLESKKVVTVSVFARGRIWSAIPGAVTEREEEKFSKSYHLAKGEMVIIPEVLSVQALAFSGGTYFAQRDLGGPEKPCYIITFDNQGQPTGEVFYSQFSGGRLRAFRSEDFGLQWREVSAGGFPFSAPRV